MTLSDCKIWWPGTESNRRRQPFQGWLRPCLRIESKQLTSFLTPNFAQNFGTLMERAKAGAHLNRRRRSFYVQTLDDLRARSSAEKSLPSCPMRQTPLEVVTHMFALGQESALDGRKDAPLAVTSRKTGGAIIPSATWPTVLANRVLQRSGTSSPAGHQHQ